MYRGVVFDFDGVLYDSEKHWVEVENSYLISQMPNWDPQDHRLLIGSSLPDTYNYLRSKGFILSREKYFADYHKMAVELYSNIAKPLQDLDVLLRKLAARKTKMAVASSSKRIWINMALMNNKLPVTFTKIVSGDDPSIAEGKPAPDVYLKAAGLLNTPTAQLIAIEDSKNGIVSAKTAGLYCFGLQNGFNEDQDLSDADDIINGYSTESINKIMSLVA